MKSADAYILGLLKQRTARDKQVKVGASNLSTPCGRCLAHDLAGVRRNTSNKWWLGAVIGTATHGLVEERAVKDKNNLSEHRVALGEIPGYGKVKSTLDLYRIKERNLVDLKTTARDKLGPLRRAHAEEPDEFDTDSVRSARFKLTAYWNQVMLYGKGMIAAGYPVDTVSIVFVCRDGKTDTDIWGINAEFDPERADAVWSRALTIWEWLQNGGDPATVEEHPDCWACYNGF